MSESPPVPVAAGEPFYRCPAGHTAKLTEVGSYQECPCGQPWGANEVVEPEPFGARLATKQQVATLRGRVRELESLLVSARELLAEAREALRWYAEETEHDGCCNDYGKRAREALAVPDREKPDV